MKVPFPGKVEVYDSEGGWQGDGHLVAAPHPNLEKIQKAPYVLTGGDGPLVTTYCLKLAGYNGERLALLADDRIELISA